VKKIKTTCHVCNQTMKTPADQGDPKFCATCGANMLAPEEETSVLQVAIATEAGGITATVVTAVLTNKRIFFFGDKNSDNSTWWLLFGAIGALIASSVKKKEMQLASVNLEDITALDVAFGTKMLTKKQKFFTIHDKDGNTYVFNPGKKEAEEWESAIRARINVEV